MASAAQFSVTYGTQNVFPSLPTGFFLQTNLPFASLLYVGSVVEPEATERQLVDRGETKAGRSLQPSVQSRVAGGRQALIPVPRAQRGDGRTAVVCYRQAKVLVPQVRKPREVTK